LGAAEFGRRFGGPCLPPPPPGSERGTAISRGSGWEKRKVNGAERSGAWRVEAAAVWISDDGRGTGGGTSRRRADVSEIARPADRQTDRQTDSETR